MRKLATMLLLAASTISLTACSGTPAPEPRAAISAEVGAIVGTKAQPATRKQAIEQKLAPACGTPTNWTPEQKRLVGEIMKTHAGEPGMQLLAIEWDRLDKAVQTCRGEC